MKKLIGLGIIFVIALSVFLSAYFVVNMTEMVVITRFGMPVRGVISTAGIYFKVPLIEKANFFEKRILEWDGSVDYDKPIPTKDKKNIIVDTTARWKINDPLVFLQTVGTEESAHSRLDDIIDSNIRDVVSQHNLIEIVRSSDRVVDVIRKENESESFAVLQDAETITNRITEGRNEITRKILAKSKPIIEKYGIELIDVRIKGLIYSRTVLENVFNRMMSQYEIKSQNLRSEGDRQKSQIEGEMDMEIKQIQSEAYKQAQIIRGQGDAEAAKIYADALSRGEEFYHFQRSLESYDKAITSNATLVMSGDSEFFRVLRNGDKLVP